MAAFAKGLPGSFVPEKTAISAMGNDMVHHGRRGQMAVFLAFRAQGMTLQVGGSRLLPACIVSSCGRAATKGFMAPFLAVHLAVDAAFAEIGTSRIAAWSFGRMRHIDLLLFGNKR